MRITPNTAGWGLAVAILSVSAPLLERRDRDDVVVGDEQPVERQAHRARCVHGGQGQRRRRPDRRRGPPGQEEEHHVVVEPGGDGEDVGYPPRRHPGSCAVDDDAAAHPPCGHRRRADAPQVGEGDAGELLPGPQLREDPLLQPDVGRRRQQPHRGVVLHPHEEGHPACAGQVLVDLPDRRCRHVEQVVQARLGEEAEVLSRDGVGLVGRLGDWGQELRRFPGGGDEIVDARDWRLPSRRVPFRRLPWTGCGRRRRRRRPWCGAPS